MADVKEMLAGRVQCVAVLAMETLHVSMVTSVEVWEGQYCPQDENLREPQFPLWKKGCHYLPGS